MSDTEKNNELSNRNISVEAEYQAIRSEILSWHSSDTNIVIYMYVLCITVIGFNLQFQNPMLLFLVYFIVFLFESMLQSFRKVTARLSAYIVVFLQTDREYNIYWESHRLELQELQKKGNGILGQYFMSQQGSKMFITVSFFCLLLSNINKVILAINCILYAVFMIFLISSNNFVDRQYKEYIELFKGYRDDIFNNNKKG